jgi:hypothetical protein
MPSAAISFSTIDDNDAYMHAMTLCHSRSFLDNDLHDVFFFLFWYFSSRILVFRVSEADFVVVTFRHESLKSTNVHSPWILCMLRTLVDGGSARRFTEQLILYAELLRNLELPGKRFIHETFWGCRMENFVFACIHEAYFGETRYWVVHTHSCLEFCKCWDVLSSSVDRGLSIWSSRSDPSEMCIESGFKLFAKGWDVSPWFSEPRPSSGKSRFLAIFWKM